MHEGLQAYMIGGVAENAIQIRTRLVVLFGKPDMCLHDDEGITNLADEHWDRQKGSERLRSELKFQRGL